MIENYQHVITELQGLENALQQLQPTHDDFRHVIATRDMALTCQRPLQDVWTQFEKNASARQTLAQFMSFRGPKRKANRAVPSLSEVLRRDAGSFACAHTSPSNGGLPHPRRTMPSEPDFSRQTTLQMNPRSIREHFVAMSTIAEKRSATYRRPYNWAIIERKQMGHPLKDQTRSRSKLLAITLHLWVYKVPGRNWWILSVKFPEK